MLTLARGAAPTFADPISTWTAGPGAVGDDTYEGYVDLPSNGAAVSAGYGVLVGGWVVDKAAQGWAGIDDLNVYLGRPDEGGKLLAKGVVAQSRPDVGVALGNPYWSVSGFSALVPGGVLPQGPTTLNVYAHTPGKGWWYKAVTVNAVSQATQLQYSADPINVITAPKPSEKQFTNKEYTIAGYALDRNAALNQGVQGTGVDRVELYLDGDRSSGHFIGDAQLAYNDVDAASYGSRFAVAGWRFPFSPTTYKNNVHVLYAYARSAVTGRETLATVGFEITEPPP